MDLLPESLRFRHDIHWSVFMVDEKDSRSASAGSIRGVILDYGEVLCHRPSPEVLAEMAGIFGIDKGLHRSRGRSEEHTSELQSHHDLVCRLLLEKKKKKKTKIH